MNKILQSLAVLLFITNSSFAHIQIGTYLGKTNTGEPCQVKTQSVEFVGGLKNPLNERVAVEFEGKKFSLQHLPILNFESGLVAPEKDYLRGAQGTATGGMGFVLYVDHSEGKDGPESFYYIEQNWKTKETVSKTLCEGLTFVK